MTMRRRRLLTGHSPGQGLVEFAGALFFLLVLICGVAQVGVFYYTLMTVETAAREAARVASENPKDTGLFSSPNSPGTPRATPYQCTSSSDPILACQAAYNSTHNALGGLINESNLTVSLEGSKYPGSSPSTCPQGTGTTDGEVLVNVTYSAPVFVPLVGAYFSGLNPLKGTVQIRVEPCTSTIGS